MDKKEKTIIVGDDDALLLSLLTEMIEFLGHKVISCSSLANLSNLSVPRESVFYFIDFSMIKNEYSVFEQLQSEIADRLVIISGSCKYMIEDQIEINNFHFLQKPFGLSEIQQLLDILS